MVRIITLKHQCISQSDPVLNRDGADRKFVPAVRTASAASVRCPHCIHICCTLPCACPRCTAIPKFYPLIAMAICPLTWSTMYFS